MAETRALTADDPLATAVLRLADDADPQVQLQLICTLGAWDDPRAAELLAQLGLAHQRDPYLRAAVLSSVNAKNIQPILATVLCADDAAKPHEPPDQQFVEGLLVTAVGLGDEALPAAISPVVRASAGKHEAWQMAALAGLLEALQCRHQTPAQLHLDLRRSRTCSRPRKTVADADAPLAERVAALRPLARTPDDFDADLKILVGLLAPQTHGDLQAAAVTALRIDRPTATATLLDGWKGHSPGLKSKILDVLVSRESSTLRRCWMRCRPATCRPAISTRFIGSRLGQAKNADLRARAAELLAGLLAGPIGASRQAVVDEMADALKLSGDTAAGRDVFVRRCAVCHKLGDVGQPVGPDLTPLADKSPEFLLIAILDPNRAVEARYVNYIAVTGEGQTFAGMLAAETGTQITLAGQEGKQQVLLRTQPRIARFERQVADARRTGKRSLAAGPGQRDRPGPRDARRAQDVRGQRTQTDRAGARRPLATVCHGRRDLWPDDRARTAVQELGLLVERGRSGRVDDRRARGGRVSGAVRLCLCKRQGR